MKTDWRNIIPKSCQKDLGKNVGILNLSKFRRCLTIDKDKKYEVLKLIYWLEKYPYNIESAFIFYKIANRYPKYFVKDFYDKMDFKDEKRILEIQKELYLKREITKCNNWSDKCILNDFWLFRGYNNEEAKQKVSEVQRKNALKFAEKRKENPEKYYASMNTRIEYYLTRGYTESGAKEKLKKRQSTFSLEKQINKLGPIQGYINWYNRQEKWQNTLNSKSEEEKKEMNKKKVVTKERYLQNHTLEEWEELCRKKSISIDNFIRKYGEDEGRKRYEEWKKPKNILSYSKESIEFLEPIYNYLLSLDFKDEDIYWKENEYCIKNKNKKRFYDFTIPKLKLIIEYHGSFWHYNPDFNYGENYTNPLTGATLNELKERDKQKRQLAINNGFKIIEVFDTDNKKEKQKEIIDIIKNLCYNFIIK